MSGVISTRSETEGVTVSVREMGPSAVAVRQPLARRVIAAGMRGPLGPQGAMGPAASETATRVLGESVSALRVVYESNGRIYKLDPTDPSSKNVNFLLGISLSSGDAGAEVRVQRTGTIDDPSWGWNQGLVFLGEDGQLTQLVPSAGWEVVVGASPSPQRLNIDFDEPVRLA